MHLLMLGPGLDVQGGVASVERLILDRLPPSAHARHVATMVDGSYVTKLWTFLKALIAIEQAISNDVDLVHIHFASDASSARKELVARQVLRKGKKVIMHAHGAEYRRYWREMTPAQQRRTLGVLTRLSALIVLGEVWREFFVAAGVPSERIVVLPNPVILPDSIPDRRGKPRVNFVYLGIIGHRKGAFELVEAIRELPAGSRDLCHFVFAGNGETDSLRGLVAKHELEATIEVRDWVDSRERDQLLADADAFVLPSRNEGMPMAMLEAMAWGLPVICTPVGSIPAVVTDGYNGLLIDPGDVSGISAAIMRLVRNDAERTTMGSAARRTVEPLAVEKYMERLQRLYTMVLAGSPLEQI